MAISWTLACSGAGSCGVILALFLTSNGFFAATSVGCILLNLLGGGLLLIGSAGNTVESREFIPFVVLNAVFSLVALVALVRWVGRARTAAPPPLPSSPSIDDHTEPAPAARASDPPQVGLARGSATII